MSLVNYDNPDHDPDEVVHNVMWIPEGTAAGLEHLRLTERSDYVYADGLLISTHEGRPYRLRYKIGCNPDWHVVYLSLSAVGDDGPQIELFSEGDGKWKDIAGVPLPEFDGCFDVDISATPFTNTLPIRRLNHEPDQSAEISILYIDVPERKLERTIQRYTCLEKTPSGGLYSFEALGSNFTALLRVDSHGLVLDYPGLFRRITLGA